MRTTCKIALSVAFSLFAWDSVFAQVPVASYHFQNSLTSQEVGAPTLSGVNPLGLNQFETQFVFGHNRTVYKCDGSNNNEDAGVQANFIPLLGVQPYSIEFVCKVQKVGAYNKIFDTSGLAADGGLYVHDSVLSLYPVAQGTGIINVGTYFHCVVTHQQNVRSNVYLNGVLQISEITDVLDLDGTLSLFLDDNSTNGFEYTDASIALLRVYDEELGQTRISDLAANPFNYIILEGAVELQNFDADRFGMLIDFEVLDSNDQVVQTVTAPLSASSTYSTALTVLPGTYSVRAKGAHWLRQRLSDVSMSGPTSQLDFSLINGDCDGDNEVTLVDFGQLAVSFGRAFGDAGFDENADLDGDQEVTLVDLGILNTAFGLSGDD